MKLDKVLSDALANNNYIWLVTGAAGFIGSHLVENLLKHNQIVRGLDNFSTGNRWNLEDVRTRVGEKLWENFSLIEADIRNPLEYTNYLKDVDFVLHQAALGSVPKSIVDPATWSDVNIQGTVQMMTAAKSQSSIKGFVYASSSSVYGDSEVLPKVESQIGKALSPYAVSKYSNELFASVFYTCYGFCSVGLRYFNVFGARQDPNGAYAAVIPKWIQHLLKDESCTINGDGATSRDFCYVDNVVQANILSALNCKQINNTHQSNRVYNVGVGENTTLLNLYNLIANEVSTHTAIKIKQPAFADFREGDIRHSLACIDLIQSETSYSPLYTLAEGLKICVPAFVNKFKNFCTTGNN